MSGLTPSSSDLGVRRPLRVRQVAVYRGPHLYSAIPMIRLQVSLGDLETHPTNQIDGFVDRLLEALPGLAEHAAGRQQSFLERLVQGVWLGHVVEHVALEIQARAGSALMRGKTRSVRGQPGVYNILYAYEVEKAGLLAGAYALALVDSMLPSRLRGVAGLNRLGAQLGPVDVGHAIKSVHHTSQIHAPGATAKVLSREAMRRGIPVKQLDRQKLLILGHGAAQARLRGSLPSRTSHIAVETASDLMLTKALLADMGLPTPQGAVAHDAQEALRVAASLRGPLVVRAADGLGRVASGLRDPEAIKRAYEKAWTDRGGLVLVEQQLPGHAYRIVVVNGEVVDVSERHVGAQLTADVAQSDERSASPPSSEAFAPATGADPSFHGAKDLLNEIHPQNAEYACQAAIAIGLDVAGVDFIAPDISISVDVTGGGIVAVEPSPALEMRGEALPGMARSLAAPVIDMLFPSAAASRIPIVSITGTSGKSSTARLVAQILQQVGRRVGRADTSGVYIGERRLWSGDAGGFRGASAVLEHPCTEIAVLETTYDGIAREGLAFRACDVGVVLNILAGHVGGGGAETLSYAAVQSVVVESVRRGGVSVLNADDPHALGMSRHARGAVAFFSSRGGAELPGTLHQHILSGGMAVVLEPGLPGGVIVLHRHRAARPIIAASAIGAADDASHRFDVLNTMAAVAICAGLNVSVRDIRRGLERVTAFQEKIPSSAGDLPSF
jgi:cyanophycin synthetase